MMTIDKLYIDGVDVQEEYGCWLKWRTLSTPSPKTNYIQIPGRDGDLDLTEALGDVYYNDRNLQISLVHPSDVWYDDYEQLVSAFHGKQCQVKFGNDPDWYWTGRLNVGAYSAKDHALSIAAKVFPYKLSASEITESVTVSGATEETAETVTLTAGRMNVTPQAVVTGSITLKWGSRTVALSEGTYYVSGLLLTSGENEVDVWGTGTVTFKYRNGSL